MKKFLALFFVSALSLMAQAGTSANVGQTVTLTAGYTPATATLPLTYTWFKNGSGIGSPLTGPELTIPNIQPADAGNYTVKISNAGGSATSAAFTVTVIPVTPPVVPVTGATLTGTVK